jgi:lipopolysaccharide biosynthesis glycosyltransferase
MKTAIFQILIGPTRGQEYCIKSVLNYCKKYNIEHFLSQEVKINGPHIMFEKYQLFNLLNAGYDRVLYLDADVLITPNAENIFEKYFKMDKFYAYDENDKPEWMDRDNYIYENISNIEWPINQKGKKQYFNAGIMLFSKEVFSKYPYAFNLNDIPNWPNLWYFGEQTIVNYWIAKNKIPFESIDYSFNRMDLGEYDLKNDRYNANFIHYAGPCKYGNGNKNETIAEDFEFLYGKN